MKIFLLLLKLILILRIIKSNYINLSSVLINYLQQPSCHLHVDSSNGLENNQSFTSDTLQSLHLASISHSFTNPIQWSQKHVYKPIYYPSWHFKISGCVSFLLIRPKNWDQILSAIEHSGYSIEPSTIFWVILQTTESLEKFSEWQNRDRFLVTDVTIIFLLTINYSDSMTVGIFCYFCPENIILLPKKPDWLKDIQILRLQIHQDMAGTSLATKHEWWVKWRGPICDPFQHRKIFDAFTCMPQGRLIINLLRAKHNFTIIFPNSSEILESIIYFDPYFSAKYPIIILPGPMSRPYPNNASKVFFFNAIYDRSRLSERGEPNVL
jgi:hypothetical protein